MMDISYLENNKYKNEFMDFASKNYYREEKLRIIIEENAVVLPLKKVHNGPLMGVGGVLDESGNYVEESAQIGKGDTLPRFYGKYDYDVTDEVYYDETVIYIGAFPEHWGHFLVDMVYRFWYFEQSESDYKVVYCSEKSEIKGVYAEFLDLLGIKKERLCRIAVPTRFSKVIIPEQAYMACAYYTNEYKRVFQNVIKRIAVNDLISYEKIYLSRGHFTDAQSKETGEKCIEENFSRNGYKVLYLEELSLQHQIFYLYHAKRIVALSGTLCHNIVFADQNAEFIILNKTHIINTHQVLLNQMMNIKVYYIDIYNKPFRKFPVSYGEGPFWLNGNKLEKFFSDQHMIFEKENGIVSLWNGIKYCNMCVGIVLYDVYARLYYKMCEYPVVMKVPRKIKMFLTQKCDEKYEE